METIGAEIDRYDAAQAAEVSALLRVEGGLPAYVEQLTLLYDEVMQEHRLAPHLVQDLSRAIATQLQDAHPSSDALPWLRERQLLLDRIDELLYGAALAPLDTLLSFGKGETRRWWQKVRGFSIAEDWGMWTDSGLAIALFRIGKPREVDAELVLHPFVPDGNREMSVAVSVNGLLLETWRFSGPDTIEPRTCRLHIPKEIVGEDGAIWLGFAVRNARSPKQLGLSEDVRMLGLGLRGVTLRARG